MNQYQETQPIIRCLLLILGIILMVLEHERPHLILWCYKWYY